MRRRHAHDVTGSSDRPDQFRVEQSSRGRTTSRTGRHVMESMCSTGKRTISFPRFSVEEDEILIRIVRARELLWKMSDADFKNTTKKEQIWNSIGLKLNKTGEQCKKRWRNIRDNCTRTRKGECSGSGKVAKRRAVYWEMLSFLGDTEEERQLTNTGGEGGSRPTLDLTETALSSAQGPGFVKWEVEDETNQLSFLSSESELDTFREHSAAKKSNETVISMLDQQRDPERSANTSAEYFEKPDQNEPSPDLDNEVDLFFKTMTATVKKFKPHDIARVKVDIFNIVSRMEILHYQRQCKDESFI